MIECWMNVGWMVEQIELPTQLLDNFLWSDKSNMNQCIATCRHIYVYIYAYVLYFTVSPGLHNCGCVYMHNYLDMCTYIHINIHTYVHMYAYMYIYVPFCTHTNSDWHTTSNSTHDYIHTNTYICTNVYICVFVCIHICKYIYIFAFTRLHVYTYVHIWICVYACMYIRIYEYINLSLCNVCGATLLRTTPTLLDKTVYMSIYLSSIRDAFVVCNCMFVCISKSLCVMRLRLPRRWWGRHQLYLMRTELLQRQIYLMRTEWLGTPHDLAWVCVCVCVFVWVFVCVRLCACMRQSLSIYIPSIHLYIYAHICIMPLNTYARTTHDLADVCACAYLCAYICIYIYLFLCT